MILIKNRKFYFSEEEDEIFAFDGDNGIKTVTFCLPSIDFQDYSFRLDLEKENGEMNIAYLTKDVQEDRILLFWRPQNSHLSTGVLKVQLRAFLAEGDEVWHSEQTIFYVGESIRAAASYPEVLPSEFIEIEKRIAQLDEHATETYKKGETLFINGEHLFRDVQTLYEQTRTEADRAAANADSSKHSSLNSVAASLEAQKYAEETRMLLENFEVPKELYPTVEIVPMQNSNIYRLIKKSNQMSTIRWCDAADSDIERTLSFTAKVENSVPYATHSFYIQVRKRDGSDATLMQLGTDGAGNTRVYCKGRVVCQLTDGWHKYEVSWNQETGALLVIADGMTVYEGVHEDLILDDAHGIQINALWFFEGGDDIISFDTFSLWGNGVLRYNDNFNSYPIGTELPAGWYKNDTGTNVREIAFNTDQEVYLSITDKNGTKQTGNIKGKDAELREGSVTQEILADGAVAMEKLSPEIQALLGKIQTMVATEES